MGDFRSLIRRTSLSASLAITLLIAAWNTQSAHDLSAAAAPAGDAPALASSHPQTQPLSDAAMGKTGIRCPITRDTWVSNVGEEADGNNGGSPQLKVKSIQEMTLLDIDPAPLRGHAIRHAWLHVHLSGKERLHRVTISTVAADWVEGTATNYAKQPGSSTFNWRKFTSDAWSFPHSDLTSVMLGQGQTIWRMADATKPDEQGWQHIAVDPRVLAARVAGISSGFLVFDDTGSEWTHKGDRFDLRVFPNRYFSSRDSNSKSAPFMTVELGDADDAAPEAPTDLKSDNTGFPPGEAEVSWLTPHDRAHAGTIGFNVSIDGQPAPRYLIPRAGEPGEHVAMHLRDLPANSQKVTVEVRAVDRAGNIGPTASIGVALAPRRTVTIAGDVPPAFVPTADVAAPMLGEASISVVDALDKMQPITGVMVPPHDAAYLLANYLWDAAHRRVRLQAARNETIAFQVLLQGPAKHVTAALAFPQQPRSPNATIYRFGYIPSAAGPMPDPLLPVGDGISIPSDVPSPAGQKNGSLYVELEVPRDATSGTSQGTLTLSAEGGKTQTLEVELNVSDVVIPDALNFLPEMNCYGLPADELAYYRLAHRNRTVLNRVPYHHNGDLDPGCAPKWDGKTLDFAEWDKRFGPLFDGSAFAKDSRPGRPVECFYLPMFENWPTAMAGNYNESYWADQAFPPSYRQAWVSVSRQFAEHCNAKGWNRTIFQCFLNGKNNFKRAGWSHGTSPWLLDEPANFQDYWALRWFGQAFHEGADPAAGNAMMCFRADISRPEWQRDLLDSVLDYNVVGGGAFNRYNRVILDRKRRFGEVVIPYGGTNDLHQSNLQPVGWCLDVWLKGGDGVLPWQTIGNEQSWKKADLLSLFYTGQPVGLSEPVPSVRLKAYQRGEQDVEYLIMLARQLGVQPGELASAVRDIVQLDATKKGTGFAGEDAGLIDFESLTPQAAWTLRTRVRSMLKADQVRPEMPRWRVPHRKPEPMQGALKADPE